MFFYYEQAKINLAEIFKKKIILLLFFSFYIIIWVVKRIYPSKNFFYIITPYLIIYTPLEMLCSSPAGHFSFSHFSLYKEAAHERSHGLLYHRLFLHSKLFRQLGKSRHGIKYGLIGHTVGNPYISRAGKR